MIFTAAAFMLSATGAMAQTVNDSTGYSGGNVKYGDTVYSSAWKRVSNKPDTAIRWPSFAEVSNKPSYYPSRWNNVASKPATATRWPTWNEIRNKPSTFPTKWDDIRGKPTTFPTIWDDIQGKPDNIAGILGQRLNYPGRTSCENPRVNGRTRDVTVTLRSSGVLSLKGRSIVINYSGGQLLYPGGRNRSSTRITCSSYYDGNSMSPCDCNLHTTSNHVDGGADFSDARLKTDFSSLESPLAALSNMKGVSYYWKGDEEAARKDVGVIAQDALLADKNLVSETEDGYYLVDYNGVIGYLVSGINELNSKIKNLESELKKE